MALFAVAIMQGAMPVAVAIVLALIVGRRCRPGVPVGVRRRPSLDRSPIRAAVDLLWIPAPVPPAVDGSPRGPPRPFSPVRSPAASFRR